MPSSEGSAEWLWKDWGFDLWLDRRHLQVKSLQTSQNEFKTLAGFTSRNNGNPHQGWVKSAREGDAKNEHNYATANSNIKSNNLSRCNIRKTDSQNEDESREMKWINDNKIKLQITFYCSHVVASLSRVVVIWRAREVRKKRFWLVCCMHIA